MPHIIVEYSKSLEKQINLPDMLANMHQALAGQGIDQSRIKTRAIAIDHAVIGEIGENGAMLHATLLLLEGRDLTTKKIYGDAIHAVMLETVSSQSIQCAVTMEIRDMDRDTYYL